MGNNLLTMFVRSRMIDMSYIIIFLVEIVFLFFSSRLMTKSLSFLPINLISFIFLPGIIIHELSHLFLASILFVPTGDIEFMPKVEGQSIKLGSVSIGKTDAIRRFFIGIAPIIFGILVISVILSFIKSYTGPWYLNVLIFYTLFVIGNTMFSSKKDMEGSILLLIMFVIVFGASYFSGIRIPEAFFANILSKGDILRQIDYFLPVVIGLNLTLFLLGKKLRGN